MHISYLARTQKIEEIVTLNTYHYDTHIYLEAGWQNRHGRSDSEE